MKTQDVIETMNELLNDNTVPKNIKQKLEQIIKSLQQPGDLSLQVNKALSILEEISEDVNLQPYTRTQIWNLVSMLETLV
ncbi:MAG: UPF0147 family protein [Candidatus Woesearchaeota archaeon]